MPTKTRVTRTRELQQAKRGAIGKKKEAEKKRERESPKRRWERELARRRTKIDDEVEEEE